jgi:hypothetical protein
MVLVIKGQNGFSQRIWSLNPKFLLLSWPFCDYFSNKEILFELYKKELNVDAFVCLRLRWFLPNGKHVWRSHLHLIFRLTYDAVVPLEKNILSPSPFFQSLSFNSNTKLLTFILFYIWCLISDAKNSCLLERVAQ